MANKTQSHVRAAAPAADPDLPIHERRWRQVKLEAAAACNSACAMCPREKAPPPKGETGLMSKEIWEAVEPHLREIRAIEFSGGGEPLLHPRLADWIATGSAAGCHTGLRTNGLLLDSDWAGTLVAASVDQVTVPLDGATRQTYESIRRGSDFHLVCGNVAYLTGLRGRAGPETTIDFVLMQQNLHEAGKIVKLAARLGVDRVAFKQSDMIHGRREEGVPRERRRVRRALRRARRIGQRLGVRTTALSLPPREVPICEPDPRDALFIRHDGCVAACIRLAIGGPTSFLGNEVQVPTTLFGLLPEQDLLEIWESPACRAHRDTFTARAGEDAPDRRRRNFQQDLAALPEPPEGCKVCRYIYKL